ncbi:type I secretion system permease/ATPase [Roseovarius sp. TE539]|uniref:type I secretion system permease/ATPase n=1 Tax=Roseovarius sp. TE539 TaxID=2249812 RepID=UPI000DDDC337|nr:type I secretion system permease/ATPase [Roseovarius sp. TE539]RBI71224.1 type I secretion system permease/ATPase [Roseovarius sp. TE539]
MTPPARSVPVKASEQDAGEGCADPDRETAPGLETAGWLARHHGRPWSDEAVRARLPAEFDGRDPETLARALATVGLKSRLVLRRLRQIDPAVLPCVLFRRDGGTLILVGFSPDRRNARVLDPASDAPEREVPLRKLARRVRREVMLASVRDDLVDRRLEASAQDRPRHWFWGPMRDNRAGWIQVIVAALLINMLGLALPIFVMNVYDKVIPNLAYVTLWTLALGVALAIGLDLALRSLRTGVLETVGRRLDTGIAATLFSHALSLRVADRPGGAAGLASHIRDFEAVREFFGSASFVSLIDLLFIGLFIFVLWMIVGPLAIVPLVAVPIVLVLAVVAQLPMGRAAGAAQALAGRRQSVLVESLMGLETIKTLNAEPVMQREWDRASAATARISGRSRFWSSFAASGTQMIQQGVSVAIIVWGVYLVAEGRITIGALIAANILAGRALAPLGTIAQTIFRAHYALRAMSALSQFMKVAPERGPAVHSSARVTRGAATLSEVTYRYPGAGTDALQSVTLEIAPGDCIALLGRVGSGKSTLGKLLCGLLSPDSGTLLIDGRGAAQYDPAELRAGVGYMPQEPELFTGTLRENLVIGRPHATESEIEEALHLAAMDRFVRDDPEGPDRFIGEKGAQLSGGQRQGLALARLLLRRPKLLFLDEPTNAMDRDMEAEVVARLRELNAAGTGLVLCTHRPALADLASRWLVMDRGRKLLDGPRDRVTADLRQAAARRAAE